MVKIKIKELKLNKGVEIVSGQSKLTFSDFVIEDRFELYFAIEKCRKMQRKVQRFVTRITFLYFLLDNAFVKR